MHMLEHQPTTAAGKRRSATALLGGRVPGLESPGYLQASLRDGVELRECLRIALRPHFDRRSPHTLTNKKRGWIGLSQDDGKRWAAEPRFVFPIALGTTRSTCSAACRGLQISAPSRYGWILKAGETQGCGAGSVVGKPPFLGVLVALHCICSRRSVLSFA